MKIKKLTLIFALSAVAFGVFGQDYAFKVLANKGANEVKSGDNWLPLKTGASLKQSDEVRLTDNGYIGLVHSTGKPIELKQPKTYTVKELESKIGTGSSVLNKYTDFILSSNSAEAKKNRLSATGAVHRATETAAISVILPERQQSEIYNSKAVVTWESSKSEGPFVVIIRNLFEDELDRIETPENTITLDLASAKLANESSLLIDVIVKDDAKQASKQHMIKKLAPADQAKVKSSLGEFFTQVEEETALNKLILAGFYEEHGLIIDAITAYEEAIRLAPEVPSYREAYEEFLLRNGFKK